MSTSLGRAIFEALADSVNHSLLSDLIKSYENVLLAYRLGRLESVLLYGGRFAENLFRVLWFIATGEVLDEIKHMKVFLEKKLEQKSGSLCVSIQVPRIAYYVLYSLRSKRDVAHVKPIKPTYIDAELVITTCNWIIAELLRVFGRLEVSMLEKLIRTVISRRVPLVQEIGDKVIVLRRLGCKKEILVLLHASANGMTKESIKEYLREYYHSSTINRALKDLIRDRLVSVTKEGKYFITAKGIKVLENELIRIS